MSTLAPLLSLQVLKLLPFPPGNVSVPRLVTAEARIPHLQLPQPLVAVMVEVEVTEVEMVVEMEVEMEVV
jgi:hypothetical protein